MIIFYSIKWRNILYVFTRLYLKGLFITGEIRSNLFSIWTQVSKWQVNNSTQNIYYVAIKITVIKLLGEFGETFEMLMKQNQSAKHLSKVNYENYMHMWENTMKTLTTDSITDEQTPPHTSAFIQQ